MRRQQDEVLIETGSEEVRAEMLLVTGGRLPNVQGLHLENAGVEFSAKGIPVDDQLRTNVHHIYAAGDVLGGPQFTHYAGWQAFQAARNALLPGHTSGFPTALPRVTFVDPEIASVGLSEAQAREQFGADAHVRMWQMRHTDRAICDNDESGFVKLVLKRDGSVLGATVMAARAGEVITEFVHALRHHWKAADLAGAIHAYPTYSTAVQQLAADIAIESLLAGTPGRVLLGLAKLIR